MENVYWFQVFKIIFDLPMFQRNIVVFQKVTCTCFTNVPCSYLQIKAQETPSLSSLQHCQHFVSYLVLLPSINISQGSGNIKKT